MAWLTMVPLSRESRNEADPSINRYSGKAEALCGSPLALADSSCETKSKVLHTGMARVPSGQGLKDRIFTQLRAVSLLSGEILWNSTATETKHCCWNLAVWCCRTARTARVH